MAEFTFHGEDHIDLEEDLERHGVSILSGEDEVALDEDVLRGGTFYFSGQDIVESDEGSRKEATKDGDDTIALDESGVQEKLFSRSDSISLDESTELPPKVFSDSIGLTEAHSVESAKGAQDAVELSEDHSLQSTRTFHCSDVVALGDGGFQVKDRIDPCADPYVSLGRREDVVLTFPYVAPSITLSLKVPLFGNTDKTETGTKVRRTPGNQLSIARGSWPTLRHFKFDFSALPEAKRDAFLAFYQASLGKEVGFLDQEDRQWRGTITSGAKTGQVGRGCDFSAGFEFQGVLA